MKSYLHESMYFKLEKYDSALSFLKALFPFGENWGPNYEQEWIFRGQSDSSWSLIPSAYRSDNNCRNIFIRNSSVSEKYIERHNLVSKKGRLTIEGEKLLIKCFLKEIEKHGLQRPIGDAELHSVSWGSHGDNSDWPSSDILPVLALAQHHGLPTRLLDWSLSPFVAAYFAACGASGEYEDEKSIAVWAILPKPIRSSFVAPEVEHGGPFGFRTVEPPALGNKNLVSQSGLFTYMVDMHSGALDVDDIPPLEEFLIRHLDWARSYAEVFMGSKPLVKKLEMPASESKYLIKLLSKIGITAANLFPGYDGIVKSLSEKESWGRDLMW